MIKDTGTTSATRDKISDFVSRTDRIDLSQIDANTKKAGNQAFKFAQGTKPESLKQGQVFFDTKTHILYGEVNGDGAADFQINMGNLKKMGSSDFIL